MCRPRDLDRDSGGRAHDVRTSVHERRGAALSRMIEPGPEFGRLFRAFDHTAFRLETRDLYRSANENTAFRQFAAGETVDMGWFQNWLTMIRESTAEGRVFCRVRVVTTPLTDYSRFGRSARSTLMRLARTSDIWPGRTQTACRTTTTGCSTRPCSCGCISTATRTSWAANSSTTPR